MNPLTYIYAQMWILLAISRMAGWNVPVIEKIYCWGRDRSCFGGQIGRSTSMYLNGQQDQCA